MGEGVCVCVEGTDQEYKTTVDGGSVGYLSSPLPQHPSTPSLHLIPLCLPLLWNEPPPTPGVLQGPRAATKRSVCLQT